MILQTKHLALTDAHIKMSGQKGIFEGYASVFGGVDSYGDTIARGAFAETLKKGASNVKMYYEHQRDKLIGKWIDLKEDSRGLYVVGEFTPNHRLAEDVYASLMHGALDGMSIGFRLASPDDFVVVGDVTVLKRIDLREVSLVSAPADSAARVSAVKSDIIALASLNDCIKFATMTGGLDLPTAKMLVERVGDIAREKAGIQDPSDAEIAAALGELQMIKALQAIKNQLSSDAR